MPHFCNTSRMKNTLFFFSFYQLGLTEGISVIHTCLRNEGPDSMLTRYFSFCFSDQQDTSRWILTGIRHNYSRQKKRFNKSKEPTQRWFILCTHHLTCSLHIMRYSLLDIITQVSQSEHYPVLSSFPCVVICSLIPPSCCSLLTKLWRTVSMIYNTCQVRLLDRNRLRSTLIPATEHNANDQ